MDGYKWGGLMKNLKRISVLGNYSGRNAGDNAILGNLLYDFSMIRDDLIFQIPTIFPGFIRSDYSAYKIRPLGLMPWNLAVRNFGYPLYKAMTASDMVLITDNILFDKNLYNPLFNNLKSISLFSSFSRRKNVPLVLYNAGVGPINTNAGIKALKEVIRACHLLIVRDNQTKLLIEGLVPVHPEIIVNADSALNTKLLHKDHFDSIVRKEALFKNPTGTISLNVNAYIDSWKKQREIKRESFCRIIAGTADKLIDELNVDVLFIVTQNMDLKITRESVSFMKNGDRTSIMHNGKYKYNELAALLNNVEIHIGMRTHSLIFAAAVGTPMISINAYPKSKAFLETIGMQDWNIDLDGLTTEKLFSLILRCWEDRKSLSEHINSRIPGEKDKARSSAQIVSDLLGI